jgi:uncharacterized protein YjbI with pentapeptide repeats
LFLSATKSFTADKPDIEFYIVFLPGGLTPIGIIKDSARLARSARAGMIESMSDKAMKTMFFPFKNLDGGTRLSFSSKRNSFNRIRLRLAEEKAESSEVLAYIHANRGWKLKLNGRMPFLFRKKMVDLSWAILSDVKLRREDLRDVNFVRANLSNADLYGCNLTGVNLSRANLEGIDLTLAELVGANLEEAILKSASLPRANLEGCLLCDSNLQNADLNGAYLGDADLSGADLNGAYLMLADFSDAFLANASFTWADLTRANLSGAVLANANLSGANLSWANLTDADLSGADLSYADLTGTELTGADLSGAVISPEQLEQAIIIEEPPNPYIQDEDEAPE